MNCRRGSRHPAATQAVANIVSASRSNIAWGAFRREAAAAQGTIHMTHFGFEVLAQHDAGWQSPTR